MKKLIGYVVVEAGQLLFIDPRNLDLWESGEFDQDESTFPTQPYESASRAVTNKQGYGQIFRDLACAISTPREGSFPIYGFLDIEGKISKVEIDFTNPNQ